MNTSRRELDPFEQRQAEYDLNHNKGFEAALDGGPVNTNGRSSAWLAGYEEGKEWAKNNQRLI
jgi:hypothetical protein